MARKAAVVSAVTRDVKTQVGEELIEALKKLDKSYEVDGTPMATVKYEAGHFKKKTLMAGWEFMPAYAYVGASGQLIVGMSPEDAQEYQFVEMNVKELDSYFPLMGGDAADTFGVKGENLAKVIDEAVFTRVEQIEAQKAKEKVESEANYGENPTFGMF